MTVELGMYDYRRYVAGGSTKLGAGDLLYWPTTDYTTIDVAKRLRHVPQLTEAQILAYCRANMTAYKQPRVIEFRDELPKTPVGKILRRELRSPSA